MGPYSGWGRPVAFSFVDDNGLTLKGDPEHMEGVSRWAGQIMVELLIRQCKAAM